MSRSYSRKVGFSNSLAELVADRTEGRITGSDLELLGARAAEQPDLRVRASAIYLSHRQNMNEPLSKLASDRAANLTSPRSPLPADVSKSEREVLKALHRRLRDGLDARTGDLADALRVSPATVTTTVKRLARRGLVEHEPYRGVALTGAGRRAATAAIRRHRIIERFLSDMLGYAWNEADRLASSFEHELPQEVEDRLFIALDRPATCPHGLPIPEPEVTDVPTIPPLYDLQPGDQAIIAVPGSVDAAVVAFLETLGLRPGVQVEVREKHPFDGPIVLRVGDHDRTLGEKVARQIYVHRAGPAAGNGNPATTESRS